MAKGIMDEGEAKLNRAASAAKVAESCYLLLRLVKWSKVAISKPSPMLGPGSCSLIIIADHFTLSIVVLLRILCVWDTCCPADHSRTIVCV